MSILITLALLQATTASPPAAQVATTPPDDAKIVCKTINTTGSRIGGKRICASKKEWRRMNQEAEQAAREIQDSHSQRPGNQ